MTATMPSKAIDGARSGISKSLIANPCERKGYFSETVRDAKGFRLRFPMPEKVVFGAAVDEAHAYVAWHLREKRPWTLDAAVAEGMKRAAGDEASWVLVEDKDTFRLQLENALHLFLSQPDGLERLQAELDGLRIQGNEGESLRADDVIGTPDYLLADGVLDVKTSHQKYAEWKFWRSPEMAIYAYLAAAETGERPARLAYQVYVRVTKPYWQWIETTDETAIASLVALGRIHAAHWRKALASGDPDLFAFDTTFCGDCPFAQPLPEVGFDGCSVGLLVPKEGTDAVAA